MSSSKEKTRSWLALYAKGCLMGIADLIPGVSGGTIALALGIHPKLLESLKTLKPKALRHPQKVAWFFLSALFLGIITSLSIGSHLIIGILKNETGQVLLRSLFLGLVLGSIYFCFQKLKEWSFSKTLLLCSGCLMALGLSYFANSTHDHSKYTIPFNWNETPFQSPILSNYDQDKQLLSNVREEDLKNLVQDQRLDPKEWILNQEAQKFVQVDSCFSVYQASSYLDTKLMLCGTLAICAMLLPGISGSQVMHLFGLYDQIIHSIAVWTKSLSTGSFINPAFWCLFNLGTGILIGLVFFSRFFIYLYKNYPKPLLSLLIGFMCGSLPSLWPYWSVQHALSFQGAHPVVALERVRPLAFLDSGTVMALSALCMAAGFFFLVFIQRQEKKKSEAS